MESEVLLDLIKRRDETIRDLDRYLPNTIRTVMDSGTVTLFEGITMRIIERTPHPRNTDYSGWYDDTRKEDIVLAVKDGDVEEYFRTEVEYDSWDNGEPDEWVFRSKLEKVEKVAVEKYVWKVVY